MVETLEPLNGMPLTANLKAHYERTADLLHSNRGLVAHPPLISQYPLDAYNKVDGLSLLRSTMSACIPLVIFDPQYRHNLDHLKYGNEGARQKGRAKYPQQGNEEIVAMGAQIERILMPSGYVMLWCDMYIHVTGASLKFFPNLTPVCDVIWDKGAIGMGYRTRRRCERAVFFQKPPIGARAAKLAVRWKTQPTIPDVWLEKITDKIHAHQKPQGLQQAVIEAITEPGQVVVDPVAGSFSVMAAAHACGRRFLGCDILGSPAEQAEHLKQLESA